MFAIFCELNLKTERGTDLWFLCPISQHPYISSQTSVYKIDEVKPAELVKAEEEKEAMGEKLRWM